MTEREWLDATEPDALRGTASDRKLRLFAVACCRRIWAMLSDARSRQAVEVTERFADGQAGEQELLAAWLAADLAASELDDPDEAAPYHAALAALWTAHDQADAAYCATHASLYSARAAPGGAEGREQARLLDDIRGVLKPSIIRPSWLTWQGGAVKRLAWAIYDDRSFNRLPVLADALEEAGCNSRELLAHLHSPGPHVRGCWALDLVLGKE